MENGTQDKTRIWVLGTNKLGGLTPFRFTEAANF